MVGHTIAWHSQRERNRWRRYRIIICVRWILAQTWRISHWTEWRIMVRWLRPLMLNGLLFVFYSASVIRGLWKEISSIRSCEILRKMNFEWIRLDFEINASSVVDILDQFLHVVQKRQRGERHPFGPCKLSANIIQNNSMHSNVFRFVFMGNIRIISASFSSILFETRITHESEPDVCLCMCSRIHYNLVSAYGSGTGQAFTQHTLYRSLSMVKITHLKPHLINWFGQIWI